MRKVLSAVLVGLAVFALVLAGLLRFYAPSRAEKTPLNLNITQIATGDAQVLNSATGKVETVPLRATRTVRTDSAASDSKNTTVNESLCIVKVIGDTPNCVDDQDPQARLVSLTTDRVTADRKTGESVSIPKYHENVDGDTTVKHVGLTYKFGFDTKKKNYQFFNVDVNQAVPAVFVGTEKRAGLNCYKFQVDTPTTNLDVGPGIPGKYTDSQTIWVEPKTGVVVDGTEHQVRTLADGSPALDVTFAFDKPSVDYQAKQAKDGLNKIKLLTVILPIVLVVIGIAAIAGVFLLGRRNDGPRPMPAAHAPTAPDEDTVVRR